jgi:hypothetical protein
VKITLADAENKPPDSPKRKRKKKKQRNTHTHTHTHTHNRNNTLKLVCTKPPVDTLPRKSSSELYLKHLFYVPCSTLFFFFLCFLFPLYNDLRNPPTQSISSSERSNRILSFSSQSFTSRPVGCEPKHEIKSPHLVATGRRRKRQKHEVDWRGENTKSTEPCAWGRRSPTRILNTQQSRVQIPPTRQILSSDWFR